jgi:hypothetical protein
LEAFRILVRAISLRILEVASPMEQFENRSDILRPWTAANPHLIAIATTDLSWQVRV